MLPGLAVSRARSGAAAPAASSRRRAQPGRRTIGCDRALRRHGPVGMDADEAAVEGRERLLRGGAERRRPARRRRRSATCSCTSSGPRRRQVRGDEPESRQQRHLPAGTLRGAGARLVRQSDLRRRPGRRDLRTVAAAGEPDAASPASGSRTTSSSRRRASTARTSSKPAYLTVFLNGVLLHNRKELMGPTVHRALASYSAAARRRTRSCCRITSSRSGTATSGSAGCAVTTRRRNGTSLL